MYEKFRSLKEKIHCSFCDCINTEDAMMYLIKLLLKTNDYIKIADKNVNVTLTKNVYDYIIHLLSILNIHFAGKSDPHIQSPELITKQISIANINVMRPICMIRSFHFMMLHHSEIAKELITKQTLKKKRIRKDLRFIFDCIIFAIKNK